MTYHSKKNFAIGTVLTAPSPATSGTTLDLQTGEGALMPATPFKATAAPQGFVPTLSNSEIIIVTDVTGDTLTYVRAQYSTTAKAIDTGWVISNGIYADDFSAEQSTLDDSGMTAISGTNVQQALSSADTQIADSNAHIADTGNPHAVTKAQVGLGNVDNTSDANKPISTATQTALDGKSNTGHTHTSSDVTDFQAQVSANTDVAANTSHSASTSNPHSVTKAQVGLGNADNTSDANKPVSTAQQTALDAKENLSNKSTNTSLGTSDTNYPSQKAVKTYVDNRTLTWSEVTGTSQAAAVQNAYIANNAGLVTITLPTTAAVGQIIRIIGKGAGGWKLAQNASQQVNFGVVSSTAGTGGYLQSAQRYDAIELVCVTANTTFNVISSQGNITVN